jgi:biopolymer transport protein ExbD
VHLATGYEERKARIEIIPLMDVIFLLLSSFIYATYSMTVYKGLRVDLPRGVGVADIPDNVVIVIRRDNTLSVDERVVSMDRAVSEAVARTRDRRRPVLVSGDRRADLGVAVELLSALRQAGVDAVSFQVREPR